MPNQIQWIIYCSKEILYNDRSNLRTIDIFLNVKNVADFIKQSGKRDILYLVDNTNNIITPDLKDLIKAVGKEIDPYIKKSAVVGTNTAQRILIGILSKITQMQIRVFDDIEQARKWLVEP